VPNTQESATSAPGRSRRRVAIIAAATAAGLVALGVPVTTLALTGGPSRPAAPIVNRPEHAVKLRLGHQATTKHAALGGTDYHAYVAVAGGSLVAEADTATDSFIAENISADTTEGVAVTPDGSQVFAAETGQYDVVAVATATGTETPIEVGAYPQDVAISPNGQQVYATVTGGDTGPGGSAVVAVINVATDAVTGDIRVGTGPRQVVFNASGSRAYVTTERGIAVIDTAAGRRIGFIPDSLSPQGIAVSPDGQWLWVTNPGAGTVWVINARTGRVARSIQAGAEPYSVAVTPDGTTAYVADLNSDSVSVISTATDRVTTSVPTGRLPASVAITPDGSQVWVANVASGSITVINPATNTVATTISGGPGTTALNAAPLGMAFVPATASGSSKKN
jgi:YVTN family beta-propeller protein